MPDQLSWIRDELAAAVEDGERIVLELDAEPAEHVVRLMATLGVPIEVVPVTAVAVNKNVRAAEGNDGALVILGAWCDRCGEESMPDSHGRCSYCLATIVDEDRLSVRELLASARGQAPTANGSHVAAPAPDVDRVPPAVSEAAARWHIVVKGTGLRYRSPMEAYVAADEIEQDGERAAEHARFDGDEAKAEKAIDSARELAAAVRLAARMAEQRETGYRREEAVVPELRDQQEEILVLFRRFQEEHGRWPLPSDRKKVAPYLPSQHGVVLRSLFGGWQGVWDALGAGRMPQGLNAAKYRGTPIARPPARRSTNVAKASGREPSGSAAPTAEASSQPPAAQPPDPPVSVTLPEPALGGVSGSRPEQEWSLALTGDFTAIAARCRAEAELLRRQAAALDRIADGVEELEAA